MLSFFYNSTPSISHRESYILMCFTQVGGIEEYKICDGLKSGRLFKPVVAWCIGTCAKLFTSEVQFGHAGACANAERETADTKIQVCQHIQYQCENTVISVLFFRCSLRLVHIFLRALGLVIW